MTYVNELACFMSTAVAGLAGWKDLLEQLAQRGRGGEQVALSFMALLADQELRLGFGLDALGDDVQTESAPQRDGRAAYRARLVIVAYLFDERTVDHDAVEGAVTQPPERHVARAEVIDEHAHTLAAQLVQGGEARRVPSTASAR